MAAGFTLEYDAKRLANPQVTLGDAAPEGATLTVNTNEAGRIGILVDSTEAMTASAMPKRIVMVTFEIVDASDGTTPISLTGSLAALGTSDESGKTLSTRSLNGTVAVFAKK